MKLYQVIPALLIAAVACSDDYEALGPSQGDGIRFGVTEQPAMSRSAVHAPDTLLLGSESDTCHVAVGVEVTDMSDGEMISRSTPIAGKEAIKAFNIYSFYYQSATANPLPFFANEKAELKGTDWTTPTLYYWPDSPGTTLDFWAMAGADAPGVTVAASTTGIDDMAIDYDVPADAAQQADLLVATTGRLNTPGVSVPLRFRHICSAIRFVFGNEMQPGTIKEITLSGIKSRGRYTTSWSGLDTPTSFTINTPKTTTGNETAGDPIQPDYNTLLMIPQPLGNDAELRVLFQDNVTGSTRTLTASLAGGEWRQGTCTTYRIGITPEYKLEFTQPVDVQDAHYVICNSAVRVSGVPAGKAWTLTATASDGADVSVQLTADVNDFAKQGFWTDKVIVNSQTVTSESARGTSVVTGIGSGDYPLTVFLPENTTDTERTITLTINVDGAPASYAATQQIKQVPPLWSGETGWEQIDDNLSGIYGFLYTAKHVYVYNYSSFSSSILNAVQSMIVNLIEQYNATNYVRYDRYYQFPGGYRYYVQIDYSLLNNLQNAKSINDGLNNTRQLFGFGGSGVSNTFESALTKLKKVQDESQAFVPRRSNDPSSVPQWVDGNEIGESQILTQVLKKNSYYLNKFIDNSTGVETTAPLIKEEDIKWYLPAYGEFAGMPTDGFGSAEYWSSTAGNNSTQSYNGGGALTERTAQLKIRAARRRN